MIPARRPPAVAGVLPRAVGGVARPTLAAAVLALVLAACGAGQQAQTYTERPTVDGTNVLAHEIALRNVYLQGPADGETLTAGATVRGSMTLVNQGSQPDRLVSVTSGAGTARLVKDAAPTSAVPIPAAGAASPAYGFEVAGLTSDLRPGQYVDMTFVFDRNGTISMHVPVSTGDGSAPRNSKRPESHGDESTG